MFYFRIRGSKWSKIVKDFPGLTENDIKNKFYSTLKSAANKLRLPQSHTKCKVELTKLVDIVLTHEELLPCVNNPKKTKIKRSKRGRTVSSDAKETSENNSKMDSKNLKVEIWSAGETSINSAFVAGFQRMVWGENEEQTNLKAGINKTFTSYQETRLNLVDKDILKR